jgi:hypothetical protein
MKSKMEKLFASAHSVIGAVVVTSWLTMETDMLVEIVVIPSSRKLNRSFPL